MSQVKYKKPGRIGMYEKSHIAIVFQISRALEKEVGVVFIDAEEGGDGPGVRLKGRGEER